MPAKRLPSSAGHLPGMGKKQADEMRPTEASAEAEAATDEVIEVHRWEGEIDAEALNDEMLKLIRTWDSKVSTSEAEQARRSKMSRQELHCVHTSMKSLSLTTIVKWANGKRVNAAFVLERMVRRLRRRLGA